MKHQIDRDFIYKIVSKFMAQMKPKSVYAFFLSNDIYQ
jgi:hypothetical protein